MTSADLAELVAAEDEPPRWVRMVCQQLAVLAAITANANRAKGARPFAVTDFLPWKEVVEQSEQEMRMICEAMSMQSWGDEADAVALKHSLRAAR